MGEQCRLTHAPANAIRFHILHREVVMGLMRTGLALLLVGGRLCFGIDLVTCTNSSDIRDIAAHGDTMWAATAGGVVKLDMAGDTLAT